MRVFVNANSLRTGGGISVIHNFVSQSFKSSKELDLRILVSDSIILDMPKNSEQVVKVFRLPKVLCNSLGSMLFSSVILPLYLKYQEYDVLLNFGDIPIPTLTKQAMVFDWSFAIYPDSVVWSRIGWVSKLSKHLKIILIKKFGVFVDLWFPQTKTSSARLKKYYGFDNAIVIPNGINKESTCSHPCSVKASSYKPYSFFYLTHYYIHKNIEILIYVASILNELKVTNIEIVLTLDCSDKNVKKLLSDINKKQLGNIIRNVGPVEYGSINSFYHDVNALIMPTLLESFSSSYIEAMQHFKPIITSRYDFAKDICGNAALYVDPLDPYDIVEKMCRLANDTEQQLQLQRAGADRLMEHSSWSEVFNRIADSLETLNEKK